MLDQMDACVFDYVNQSIRVVIFGIIIESFDSCARLEYYRTKYNVSIEWVTFVSQLHRFDLNRKRICFTSKR